MSDMTLSGNVSFSVNANATVGKRQTSGGDDSSSTSGSEWSESEPIQGAGLSNEQGETPEFIQQALQQFREGTYSQEVRRRSDQTRRNRK